MLPFLAALELPSGLSEPFYLSLVFFIDKCRRFWIFLLFVDCGYTYSSESCRAFCANRPSPWAALVTLRFKLK